MTHDFSNRSGDYIGQLFGDYELLRLLDHGGFTDVYLAKHIYFKNLVAVKILVEYEDREKRHKLLQEARLLRRLNHPHIVSVFNFSMQDVIPYFVMTYAENGSLQRQHPSGQILSMPIILHYLHQLANALDYLHSQGIIHQDIKPANILLQQDNKVLLCDLGIALKIAQNAPQRTQVVVGTVVYMAPERFAHPEQVSAASDQYSLGILVFEWLTGSIPFHGSRNEIAWHHIHTPAPPLHTFHSGIPSTIERVVLKTLEKDPRNRFASVQEFATALTQAWNDSQLQPKPQRKHSRLKWVKPWNIIPLFFILDLLTFLSLGVASYLYDITPDTAWIILLITQLILCMLFSLMVLLQHFL